MTLELLKAGLQQLINQEQYADEAKQAIKEIEQVQQLAGPDDIFKGECYVLHSETVSDLLNIATYDAYGKLFVEHNRAVSLDDYEKVIRCQYGCDLMPSSAIELGYSIIGDLYEDNEDYGCHKPDGTFRSSLLYDITDLNEMYTADGLKVLFEEVDKLVTDWHCVLEEEPDNEIATERLAVLSNLHVTLNNLIN